MMKFYIMHSKTLLHKFQDTKIKKILSIDFRKGKVVNTQRTGNQNGNNLRHWNMGNKQTMETVLSNI